MANSFMLICFLLIALHACTILAATTTTNSNSNYDNRDARYNPYRNDPYHNSRYYKNRGDYYNNNRQYYDNYLKRYNPDVLAPQARILEQQMESNHDGAYSYSFETDNGIHVEERGVPIKVGTEEQKEVVEGSYSYVTPEGMRIIVKYTADENGFHPTITYEGVNSEKFSRLQRPADVVITN